MGLFQIDKALLPVKAHYFLINGAHAGVIPFIAVYAKQMGITADTMGYIFAVVSLVTSISKPLLGGLVDHLQKLKLVLVSLILIDIVADIGLNFIPQTYQDKINSADMTFVCQPNSTYVFNYEKDLCETRLSNSSAECMVSCQLCKYDGTICARCSESAIKDNYNWTSFDYLTNFTANGVSHKLCCLKCLEDPTLNYTDNDLSHKVCCLKRFEDPISNCTDKGLNHKICHVKCLEDSTSNYTDKGSSHKLCYLMSLEDSTSNCTEKGLSQQLCYLNCVEDSTSCSETGETNPILQMWLLAVFTIVIFICLGSIFSLSDAACFNALGARPELYGRQRMWGTIGWGLCALIAGYLNQISTGDSQTYSFSSGFFMLIVVFVIDMAIIPSLKLQKVRTSKNIFKDVGRLILKPRIAHFILQVFAIGVLVGFTRTYLYWYLRILNASQLVLGVASTVQCFLGELPFFFFAGWIIAKVGHVNTFTMSFAAHGVRFLLCYFLINPWWVLPIEILQGPCFGIFYAAMVSYAKVVAPEGTEATVQGLASGVFEGLGTAVGSIIGGYGFLVWGSRETFLWFGIASILLALLNTAYDFAIARIYPSSA